MNILIKDNMCTIYKVILHRVQRYLQQNGHEIVSTAEHAEVVIVGLCAGFEADENRSIQLIRTYDTSQKPLIAYGCLTQVAPETEWGGGTLTYPSWDYQRLAEDLVPNPVIQWNSVPLPTNFRAREDYRVYNPKRHFVGISSGCSFACSYCPHKIGAGDIASRLPSEIISTVQELIDDKAETIIITGTDTAAYGRDINYSFPRLAHDILGIPNNFTKFHIAQFNPEGLFDELSTMIDCCSNKLVADIQLPIQTTSVRLLQLMNRKYSPEGVKGFIEKVREMNTELMFRTDLMVGFPTETENELEDTIDFAIQYFDEIAVYAFEYKHCVPLASLNLHIFPPQEIQRRQEYARDRLKSAGKLVHSGGQDIESLLLSDNTKETFRK